MSNGGSSRRDFIKYCAGLGLGGWLLSSGRPLLSAATGRRTRPNILFIVIDDLPDWVTPLGGHPNIKTPNMERLSRRGMNFTQSYCPSPLCGPSRAAVLSGMRATTTGLYRNTQEYLDLLADAENLPVFFRKQGYKTMGAGKIFHGAYPQYWDEYIANGERLYQAGQPKRSGLDIPGIFDWGALDCDDSDMDDYRMAQFAIDRLKQDHGNQPFFLGCGLYLPHVPWYAPKKYFEMYPLDTVVRPLIKHDDTDDLPKPAVKIANLAYSNVVEKSGKQLEATQALLASITFADAQLGRILDALEAGPYADNTIVVLWGDNGTHLGSKRHWHKDTLWKEATRVPMMISVPGMTAPGSVCNALVSPFDLYPTLAELAGLTPPAAVEGHSLVPLLKDPKIKWPYPAIMTRAKGQVAIRLDNWRYIRYEDGSEELYNLDTDPQEWYNLAGQKGYEELKRNLAKHIPPIKHQ